MAQRTPFVKFFNPNPELFLSERHGVSGPSVAAPPAIATPCVQVCIVDGASGLCLGCHRTLAEIAGWRALTEAQRAAVTAELPGRRDRIAAAGHKVS